MWAAVLVCTHVISRSTEILTVGLKVWFTGTSALWCWLLVGLTLWDQYIYWDQYILLAALVTSLVSFISSAISKVITWRKGCFLCSRYFLPSTRQCVQVNPSPICIFFFPHMFGIQVTSSQGISSNELLETVMAPGAFSAQLFCKSCTDEPETAEVWAWWLPRQRLMAWVGVAGQKKGWRSWESKLGVALLLQHQQLQWVELLFWRKFSEISRLLLLLCVANLCTKAAEGNLGDLIRKGGMMNYHNALFEGLCFMNCLYKMP